jgi:hypothetical protein
MKRGGQRVVLTWIGGIWYATSADSPGAPDSLRFQDYAARAPPKRDPSMRSLFHRPIRAARHLCARKQTVAPVELLEGRTLFSAPPVIDVMVLYTPAALADAGSIGVLDNRIHRAVADTNLALSNSQVNAGIRLVHEGEVSYSESGIINTDLDNLQSGSGALSGVQSLRSQYGADLVSLWVGRGDEGGRAFQPGDPSTPWPTYGFNVVQERYAADNYVFAHEIGHNLGAGHDRSDPMPRAIPIAYGKTFSAGSYTIGDIMSDVERIPYYSNPNVSFRGIPTGNPDNSSQPADNARVMNEFAPLLASYEPSKVPDTTFPVAAIQAVVVSHAAQSLNVKVEYAADLPVSVGGLGTGDIVVTGPSGFHQVAWFQGVDFTTDGMQRVASYQRLQFHAPAKSGARYIRKRQPRRNSRSGRKSLGQPRRPAPWDRLRQRRHRRHNLPIQ